MKRFPTVFSALLVHQIEVGETTGKLGDAVRRIVSQLENRSQLRSFLLKKLTYPCVLLSAGFCCVVFMLTNVIPTFQAMYKESGAVLPSITQFLVDLSSLCTQHGILVLLSMASAGLAIAAALANSTSRHAIDGWLLKVPLLGNWLRNVSILQFTETLGNLLESGIQLTDALPAAAKTVTNRYARERLLGLHAAIRRGEKLSSAMSSSQDHLFPPVVRQLVIVGEKSGKLAEVTRQIHTHLKADVEKHTAIMLAAIEPLITALLASVIGTILLAVYLPMFDMLSNQPH
jgi:type IV pilus assembly protein PilC